MGGMEKLIRELTVEKKETEIESLYTMVPYSMRMLERDKIKMNALASFFGEKSSPFAYKILRAGIEDIFKNLDENQEEEFFRFLCGSGQFTDQELEDIFEITNTSQTIGE